MTCSARIRRIGLCLTAVFALVSAIASAQTAPKDRFKVQIEIDHVSLNEPGFKKDGEFFVITNVTNISHHEEQITAWGQPGWSWISNNKVIKPGIEAAQSFKERITLAPYQVYSSHVEMWVDRSVKGPITFRMGFVPNATSPASTNPDQIKNWGGVFWSNYVTLHP